MQSKPVEDTDQNEQPFASENGNNGLVPNVVACVDTSPVSRKVVSHARTIARALGGELSLVHFVETGTDNAQSPSDPIEWDIRRRKANLFLSSLASQFESRQRPLAFNVLEGNSIDQIECPGGHAFNITAFCRSSEVSKRTIGATARRIVDGSAGSLLLVPNTVPQTEEVTYSRILVPLDGSSRAEAAIPVAMRIAKHEKAEIVLLHVTPKIDLIGGAGQRVKDMELQEELTRRNARLAREYIERTRASLLGSGIDVRCVLLKGGDARRRIEDSITSLSIDLLVMSSHGQSGYSDVPIGDVSNFVLSRTSIPVLIVRRPHSTDLTHVYSSAEASGIRRPAGTSGI
ncbi:universal stress protein [Hoeflea prorocentri]|uniref:Universal stress protein n=1 Tax=Hoeflea prorocentri TaxID=1922333 RepID=A0A9X3UE66_9HYPH|nr:universal stress protein [Hoeflea prorocentri]MCY6379667.1 universal stress protein [Hoeflea prorocentri]MDA5397467.1 universal stress protein [Hoeflea prorocentri]